MSNRASRPVVLLMVVAAFLSMEGTSRAQKSDATPKKIKRPSNLSSAAEYLQQHGSTGQENRLGGGGGATNYTDPLSRSRDDPNYYVNKRRPPPTLGTKKRQPPSKPRIMSALPSDNVRKDRSFVNGITPQHSLYTGTEGSRYQREPDARAARARAVRPQTVAKPKPVNRSAPSKMKK